MFLFIIVNNSNTIRHERKGNKEWQTILTLMWNDSDCHVFIEARFHRTENSLYIPKLFKIFNVKINLLHAYKLGNQHIAIFYIKFNSYFVYLKALEYSFYCTLYQMLYIDKNYSEMITVAPNIYICFVSWII
jgi:hypothetical protein